MSEQFSVRPATFADARAIWLWRTDPTTRANAFMEEDIVWESHCEWLRSKLNSSTTRMWMLERHGEPVAQARFDRSGNEAEVSITTAPESRGQGCASALLKLSVPFACRELHVATIFALVKRTNVASMRAFERAGFVNAGDVIHDGIACIKLTWHCSRQVSNGHESV